jgi:FkbM family methyltransferase
MTDLPMRLVRMLATAPGFRRLTRVRALLRVSYALRAALVQERRRFALNELRRRESTGVYRLRESGVAFAARHHTGDILVLDEIFSQREYEPPLEAEAALAGLPAALQVVDLGANIGLFGAWVLGRFPGARIVAVEADPANAEIHRRTIEANGLGARWELVEAFASTATGEVRFAGGQHATSHEAEDGTPVPAVDAFPLLADGDLLKIDIEGGEWAILGDARFAGLRPSVVVLEYHQDGCPESDAASAASDALRAAGLDVVEGSSKPEFGAGIVWGLARPDATPADDSQGVAEHQ